jgi:hypothetical protein
MLRKLLDLLTGRHPPELQSAFAMHRQAVERSIAGSRASAGAVRDVRLNTKSAIEAVDQSWDLK